MGSIELLGTSGCHLCEVAERLVRRIAPALGFQINKVDIALDDALFEQYGMHIPVLRQSSFMQSELFWPFDEQQLQDWLSQA